MVSYHPQSINPPYIHPNSTLPLSSLYVYNKVDGISLDFLNEIAHEPYTTVMSCELDLGVQDVVDRIWKELRLIRIYTKRYVRPPYCGQL